MGDWAKYTYSAYFPPTPPQPALCKKNGRLSRFAKQPPNGRLDLDRLAAFCYLTKLVGLRKTKPRRQDLRARLRACRPRRHISRASPLLRRLSARFAAPAATVCALRRSCGDFLRASPLLRRRAQSRRQNRSRRRSRRHARLCGHKGTNPSYAGAGESYKI